MTTNRSTSRELTTELIVGGFMMMVLLGLAYFTIILSRESWFAKKIHKEVVFQDVMGLRDGDSVVCRGMPVGKILTLDLREDGVHVIASLDRDLTLHEDYRISIETTSMLGGRHMRVEEGTSTKPKVEPPYTGATPYDLVADAAAVVNGLKKGLIEDGAIDNIRQVSVDLREISGRLAAGEGTLGKLLSKDSALYDDLRSTVASVKTVVDRVEKGEGTLGKLLSSDDTVYRDLAAAVAALKSTAERFDNPDSTLGKLMSDDAQIYRDIADTATSLKNVMQRIDRGEGLLGRLTVQGGLDKQVDAVVSEVRQTLDDMRETTPITTFTSIFFGVL